MICDNVYSKSTCWNSCCLAVFFYVSVLFYDADCFYTFTLFLLFYILPIIQKTPLWSVLAQSVKSMPHESDFINKIEVNLLITISFASSISTLSSNALYKSKYNY